jgi:hypothetical protein
LLDALALCAQCLVAARLGADAETPRQAVPAPQTNSPSVPAAAGLAGAAAAAADAAAQQARQAARRPALAARQARASEGRALAVLEARALANAAQAETKRGRFGVALVLQRRCLDGLRAQVNGFARKHWHFFFALRRLF